MKYYDYNILCELIDEGLIEVLSEKEVINPHIKGFDFNIPVDRQKDNISMRTNYSVFYPTRKALESVPLDYTKPYSVLMQKGEKQFKIIYFNIEILKRYVNNPECIGDRVVDNLFVSVSPSPIHSLQLGSKSNEIRNLNKGLPCVTSFTPIFNVVI